MLFISGVLLAAWLLQRYGERFLQQPADEVLLRDGRRPVLYLRSFSDDLTSQPTLRFISPYKIRAEELLVLLNVLGPFVAIGRPGEALPLLGANRWYVSDSDWKHRVAELMAACRLTVILARAATQGLEWEITQARLILSPTQLVFYFPQEDHTKQAQHYQAFKMAVSKYFPIPFPDGVSSGGFLRFGANWVPEFVGSIKRNPSRATGDCVKTLITLVDPNSKITFLTLLALMPRYRLYFLTALVVPLPIIIGLAWAFPHSLAAWLE
jgi:hypothetical protein